MTSVRVSRPRAFVTSSRWPVVAGVLFWLIIPVLCLVSLSIGIVEVARHVDNLPLGTRGTFQVVSRTCHGGPCVTTGTFTSNDKTVLLSDVRGDDGWLAGKKYNAVYQPKTSKIVALANTWDPAPTVVGMAGAVGFLAVWAWLLRRRFARRTGRVDTAARPPRARST